jgi:hypothetical protein
MTWEINSFVWFELNSKSPSLLMESFDRSSMVPQLFLSSTPPFDLQLITANEWFGFKPKETTYGLGTARTGCPAEMAFLMTLAKSLSVERYFLTGAPVKSLK